METPDANKVKKMISNLKRKEKQGSEKYGEVEKRIKNSRTHLERNSERSYYFELKSTTPDENYTLENSKQLINYYTQKLYTATKKTEVAYFLHQRGCVYFDTYEYDLAETDFKESLKYNPQNSWLFYDYCDLCCIFGRKQESLECGLKSIEINPQFPTVYISLATCYNSLDQPQNALECCFEAIKLDSYYIGSYYEMAYTYQYKLFDVDSAFEYYTFAIEVSKLLDEIDEKMALSITYRSRASVYCEQREFNLSLKDLEMAIFYDKEIPSSYFDRGYTRFEMEEYEESVRDFTLAIEKTSIREISEWEYYWRGMALCQIEKYEEALQDFLISADFDKKNDLFYFRIGELFLNQGNYEESDESANVEKCPIYL
eukprot:gene12566-6386_t